MINTFLIILEQTALYLPLVLGGYFSMSLLKLPDLSIESAYVFGAILGAQTVTVFKHTPTTLTLFLALLASALGGTLVGLTSSCISRIGQIPHLLASIITFGIFHGINQIVMGSAYFSLAGLTNPLELIPNIHQHPELIMLLIIGTILMIVITLLFKTQLSYACAIFGNNQNFFTHYGISNTYIVIVGVMIGNALAGISGYLFAQSNGFVELTIGYGKALLCITALILGKALAHRKSFSSLIPVMGTSAYFVLQQFLLKVGFNLKFFTAVQSLLVFIFILLMYRAKGQALRSDQLGV